MQLGADARALAPFEQVAVGANARAVVVLSALPTVRTYRKHVCDEAAKVEVEVNEFFDQIRGHRQALAAFLRGEREVVWRLVGDSQRIRDLVARWAVAVWHRCGVPEGVAEFLRVSAAQCQRATPHPRFAFVPRPLNLAAWAENCRVVLWKDDELQGGMPLATVPRLPFAPRACASHKDAMYVLGHRQCRRYDVYSNTWEDAPPMLGHRAELGACVVAGKLVVVGSSGHATAFAEMLDLSTNTWSRLPPPPVVVGACSVTGARDAVFVVGATGHRCKGDAFEFSMGLKMWSDVPPMDVPRVDVAAVAVQDKLYVCGGYTLARAPSDVCEVLDTKTQEWQRIAPMPDACAGCAIAHVRGKLVLVGSRTVYCLQLDVGTWAPVHSLKSPTPRFVVGNIGARVFVFGNTWEWLDVA